MIYKISNWNIIWIKFQAKHFGKYYFQCDIGTDSLGSSKPITDFNIKDNYVDKDDPRSRIYHTLTLKYNKDW